MLGENDMLAYLAMMAPRLVDLRRVLKPTGSIYLHCHSTASHYLKVLMDAIFGPRRFRTEIIWKRTSSHGNVSASYGEVTDPILYYARGDHQIWNQVYVPYLTCRSTSTRNSTTLTRMAAGTRYPTCAILAFART